MKRYTLKIMTIAISTVLFVSCANNRMNNGSSIFGILENANVLTMLQWGISNRKILCAVTADTQKIDGSIFSNQKLAFYEITSNKLIKVGEYEDMGFLNMYLLYDGNLLTLWGGGTSVEAIVFTANDTGQVKSVLGEGIKGMPEIVNGNKILFSWGSDFKEDSNLIHPESTSIYNWNGTSYVLINSVPWKTRFDALRELKK